jgi:predicted dehydrogenase
MKRRTFLISTLGLTAASYSQIKGANGRLGVALVGSGRRGRLVMQKLLETGRVELRSLCDVWDVQRERAKKSFGISEVHETQVLEETLGRSDIDAVLLATPDHLHKDYAIKILESGRHLYLEKPKFGHQITTLLSN